MHALTINEKIIVFKLIRLKFTIDIYNIDRNWVLIYIYIYIDLYLNMYVLLMKQTFSREYFSRLFINRSWGLFIIFTWAAGARSPNLPICKDPIDDPCWGEKYTY